MKPKTKFHQAYIALGSNLDNPRKQILTAVNAINALPDCEVVQCSSLYETEPVGYLDQPNFINAVLEARTSLSPLALLHALQSIELQQGRLRSIKNGPRTLDLDLILYENVEILSEELVLPHPRMHERGFVLIPLYEIAPQLEILHVSPQ